MSKAEHRVDFAAMSDALGRPSQCRRDALSGRWVIFAPGRSKRPAEIVETELPVTSGAECPFCAGNEQNTPPATLCLPNHSGAAGQWSVRVVPNLYPAVLPEEDFPGIGASRVELAGLGTAQRVDVVAGRNPLLSGVHYSGMEAGGLGAPGIPIHTQPAANVKNSVSQSIELFEAYRLHGGHEVIVESPQHVESITHLEPGHVTQVFVAYAERMKYWYDVAGIEYVVAFKNVGAAAGASLRHTHSQLIATSLLPPAADETGQRTARHYHNTTRCLLCETVAAELSESVRIVRETESLVAFCPFASRLPYLVRIAPKRHLDRFEMESEEVLGELAVLTRELVGAMESMFVTCAYNYMIHSRPRNVGCAASYHWWLEIFPRLTKVAGFEWGSDCYINPVTPEVAAAHLRGEPFGEDRWQLRATDSAEFSD